MNKKKQYSLLTNSDIDKGIEDKIFKKEDISLIRDAEGKIVKHLPPGNTQSNNIPPSLIQINNNYICQADIRVIVEAIIETKNADIFQNLSVEHQAVIDCLTYYKDHNSRLDELNRKALDASSAFESRTNTYLNDVNVNYIEKVDIKSCKEMLDTYLDIIFVYLISTYWLNKETISKDSNAKRKIEKLQNQVRNIYEQLLASSSRDKDNRSLISMDESLYAKYFLREKDGILEIEKFIKHDSRFSSLTDFVSFIQREFFKKIYSSNDYSHQYQQPERYEISINLNPNSDLINRKTELAKELFNVLEKLEMLKNIQSELVEAGKIDFSLIDIYSGSAGSKDLQLQVIPLALNGNT